MFEGVPTYPDAGRCWEVVDKHQVNIFYTAPTAIRALQAVGDEPVTRSSALQSETTGHCRRAHQPRGLGRGTTNVVGDSAAPSSTPGGRPKPGDI